MNSSSQNSSEESQWNPCPSSPYGVQVFFVVEAVNLLFGLPVNAWTVWLISHNSHSIQASEVFTLNLALLECVYSLLSFLRPLNYYVIKSTSLYTFNLFFYGLLSAGRPLFQACVCLERYLGVVHPVSYLRYNSVRTRLCTLPLVWGLILSLCVCNIWKLVLAFPILFLLLLLLQAYCCVRILQVLCQPGPGDGTRKHKVDPAKKKAFITVLVIQVMMVLNYLPMVLVVPLRGRLSRHSYVCQLLPASLSFSVFGSFIQPLMYLMRRGKFPSKAKG
ncbi:hydroxycarboxylic acid receptor 3-like [Dicentrarchus labrax]|uniref:hydroxycarboxylic acid receptor 3-like n=1 Tax=Dicentrarchus labrax TaxID=13489 RepID=UPI0021F615FD|nr:hydroxycarboxylic acid receptor 3-like [Dicentrarchus labrax]